MTRAETMPDAVITANWAATSKRRTGPASRWGKQGRFENDKTARGLVASALCDGVKRERSKIRAGTVNPSPAGLAGHAAVPIHCFHIPRTLSTLSILL